MKGLLFKSVLNAGVVTFQGGPDYRELRQEEMWQVKIDDKICT